MYINDYFYVNSGGAGGSFSGSHYGSGGFSRLRLKGKTLDALQTLVRTLISMYSKDKIITISLSFVFNDKGCVGRDGGVVRKRYGLAGYHIASLAKTGIYLCES